MEVVPGKRDGKALRLEDFNKGEEDWPKPSLRWLNILVILDYQST